MFRVLAYFLYTRKIGSLSCGTRVIEAKNRHICSTGKKRTLVVVVSDFKTAATQKKKNASMTCSVLTFVVAVSSGDFGLWCM